MQGSHTITPLSFAPPRNGKAHNHSDQVRQAIDAYEQQQVHLKKLSEQFAEAQKTASERHTVLLELLKKGDKSKVVYKQKVYVFEHGQLKVSDAQDLDFLVLEPEP